MPNKLQDLVVDDHGVALDPATGATYRLTGTALPLIRLLQKGYGESDLLQYLLEEYEVDQLTARRDLDMFLSTLERMRWMEEAS